MHLNIEIKAQCPSPEQIHTILAAHNARLVGSDHQVDTYFAVPNGRLKLRQGNIENHLIHYNRTDQAGPKASEVHLYAPQDAAALKATLMAALPVQVVVDKVRTIYFIDNVKFHVDTVAELGSFVEIEAIDLAGDIGAAQLQAQCEHWMEVLKIAPDQLLTHSYSDMLRALLHDKD